MKLTTTTNVSVDGVMQACDGPDEDHSDGFERGEWSIPLLGTTPATREIPKGESKGTVAVAIRQKQWRATNGGAVAGTSLRSGLARERQLAFRRESSRQPTLGANARSSRE